MRDTQDYINSTELEFDSESNRSYYESRIGETIDDVKRDVLEEVLSIFNEVDGNTVQFVNRVKELKYKVIRCPENLNL